MGKGSRLKAQRRERSRRRITVVDGLEIGQKDGMVTLRTGHQQPGVVPVRFAMPANMFEAVVPPLLTAAQDAEDQYWRIIGPLVDQVPDPSDPAVVVAHTEAWLLKQDWESALNSVPGGGPAPFVLSHAGHVGLAIDPPFTAEPLLFVFDPTQLRRVAPTFKSAVAQGHRTPPTAPWSLTQSLNDVHRFLAARPWPVPAWVGPTPQEAEAEMRRQYVRFLGRSPFIRPAENNLCPGEGGGQPETDVETTTGCERCDISRAFGGILCVCGHDWSCHDGAPGGAEPCTHCSCAQMADSAA